MQHCDIFIIYVTQVSIHLLSYDYEFHMIMAIPSPTFNFPGIIQNEKK